ncbi:MAG TPA: hypothetical protein PLN24_09705 [Victivallales bacterium]|nr:hypothetical protein [Victivallales bacterium]HPO89686.1 hypothetical protein [Victivallales bacterium]
MGKILGGVNRLKLISDKKEKEDEQAFEETIQKLTQELTQQMEESKRLDEEIKRNLEKIGWKI